MTIQVFIQCMTSANEQPILDAARRQLAAALASAAGPADFDIKLANPVSLDQIARSTDASIVITSMMAEAEHFDVPWQDVERDLRERYTGLTANENLVVYLCTVFRHVPPGNVERARQQRTRIRRLNLLAAELSRETGLFVIDIDRAFADVGAQALATDYRLSGPFAVAAAAHSIADTVLATGFDAFASFEIQEAARRHLLAEDLPRATPPSTRALDITTNTMTLRSGKRTQTVQVTGRKAAHMGSFVRQILTGRLALRDAASTVLEVVARRGVWHVFSVAGRQASRAFRLRKATR